MKRPTHFPAVLSTILAGATLLLVSPRALADGACCMGGPACYDAMDEIDCQNQNGFYLGDGTSCTPNPCPVGACCYDNDASCALLSSQDCNYLGGTYRGDQTSCYPSPCPNAPGACCQSLGICSMLSQSECSDAGGEFQGGDVPCSACPIYGACCFTDGNCDEQSPSEGDCAAGGGSYLGDFVPCHCAGSDYLYAGQAVTLDSTGGGGDPTQDALVTMTNTSGVDGGNIIVGEIAGNVNAGTGRYRAVGRVLRITTTLSNGQFLMTVQIPFTQSDLPPAFNALLVDLTYFDTATQTWTLAVASNVQDSVRNSGSKVGGRFVETASPPDLSQYLRGDYGVYWDGQNGFAWGIVDHATAFSGGALVDCNNNGVQDADDIGFGTSQDCNGNGTPDECELTGNDVNHNNVPDDCDPDCNHNGVPDDLDIANGQSQDVDHNGVPDQCDLHVGDTNCDGRIDNFDIGSFVSALIGEETYEPAYPNCNFYNADTNFDGQVDFDDQESFCTMRTPSQVDPGCGTGSTFTPGSRNIRLFFSSTDHTAGTPQEWTNQQNALLDTTAGPTRAYLWAKITGSGNKWDGIGLNIRAGGNARITDLGIYLDGTVFDDNCGCYPRWQQLNGVPVNGPTQFAAINLLAVTTPGIVGRTSFTPDDNVYVDVASKSYLLGWVELTGAGDVSLGVADMGIRRATGTPATDAVYFGFGDNPVLGTDFGACTTLADLSCVNTAVTNTGTNVAADLAQGTGAAGGVSMTYSSVTSAGLTTLSVSETGPPLPEGFQLGSPAMFYDLDTTATVTTPIHICFNYSNVSYPDENQLQILHYENGAWANVTTSLDTVNNIICCDVNSLSPFVIGPAPASANQPPTAVAGDDQSIRAGQTVNLSGAASFDDNTPSAELGYAWSFSLRPGNSNATLANAGAADPSFVADVAGTYIVALVVTDGDGFVSVADEVLISSANLPPNAIATADRNLVILNETVNLDGTSSSDPEHDALSYSWTLVAAPAGSSAGLSGSATATAALTPDVAGVYEVSLEVSDFLGPGEPTTIQISATTASAYADTQVVLASAEVSALTASQVTTRGNQTALNNFLSQASLALQQGNQAAAIDKIRKALERCDGCALRGSPDGNGPSRDWITDCAAQSRVYGPLQDALDALTQ